MKNLFNRITIELFPVFGISIMGIDDTIVVLLPFIAIEIDIS